VSQPEVRARFEQAWQLPAGTLDAQPGLTVVEVMHAIKHGKHVCVQKPLCNYISEVRDLHRAAKDAKIVTQMGNQGRTMDGQRLVSLKTSTGNVWNASVFLDCTYEGDLMAKAGVASHIGREANAVYSEKLNGIRPETAKHQFTVPVDPFIHQGDASSGLLPFIESGDLGEPGAGDASVQAYNFRLCMTRDARNRRPWEAPENYNPAQFELLARYIEARSAAGKPLDAGQLFHPLPMPNHKTDTNNNGGFSTDFIGGSDRWPEASYTERAAILKAHERYTRGFFYFLATNPRVPEKLRAEVAAWGLTKDEWPETSGWPPQLYVREARRMISDYVMTEHDCRGTRKAPDAVGLGAYNMDSHNCRRIVRNGLSHNEGDVQEPVKPYPVSWRSLIPKATECSNLAVPVCLAASHMAYGSIRMEPVFMILAQSAATGACLALDRASSPHEIPSQILRDRLAADGQILSPSASSPPNPPPLKPPPPRLPADPSAAPSPPAATNLATIPAAPEPTAASDHPPGCAVRSALPAPSPPPAASPPSKNPPPAHPGTPPPPSARSARPAAL
jgi:hypothetical protein